MSEQQIRPKQLRALLLLLVLVPLIPTALMIRFMADALKGDRLDALERTQERYSQLLEAAINAAPRTEGTPPQRAVRLYVYLAAFLDTRVSIRIIDGTGQRLAGEHSPWGQPIVQAVAPIGAPSLAQVFFSGPEVLDAEVAGPKLIYTWTGIITTVALLLITGTAAMAVRRQVALHELKSTSVATVAHELRTPLGAIRMLVDTLREGRYRSDNQVREYLDLIAAENDRLSRLAENFLTFSRLDATSQKADFVPVEPHAVAARAAAYLRPRLDAPGCTFLLDVPESLPRILADSDSLAQVFTNLLDNALKYTGVEKRIALRAHAEPASVVFAVEDNGIGIPGAERKAIFEPFHQIDDRLSRAREGCGLGLAIARLIVRAHGGKIEVASTPEKGSVFTVRIPRA